MDILALGILAAGLQILGYLAYGFKVLRRDILPNAASWIMFAYGTSLLVILEFNRGASFALLALPLSCALASIFIARYAMRKTRRAWWPEHWLERLSFFLDVVLTAAYLGTWILIVNDLITAETKETAELLILMCWTIGVFTAFFPLLRQVFRHPASEHALPWLIWSLAYGCLLVVTVMEEGVVTELVLYPLTNLVVHGFIAYHTAYWRYMRRLGLL